MLDIVMHNVLIFFYSKSRTFSLQTPILLLAAGCAPEVYSSTNQAENASGAAMRMEKPQSKTPQFGSFRTFLCRDNVITRLEQLPL